MKKTLRYLAMATALGAVVLIWRRGGHTRDTALGFGGIEEQSGRVLPQVSDRNSGPERGRRQKEADVTGAKKNEAEDFGTTLTNALDATLKIAAQADRVGLDLTRMSDHEESQLGVGLNSEILRNEKIFSDSALQKRVLRLATPIIEQCERKGMRYNFQFIDSSEVNAFSVAGGYIYITTGFLKRFSSDSALTFVLGHEIGHVDLRHCVEKLQYYSLGKKVVGGVASYGLLGYNTLRAAYTKVQEFEADKFGFSAGIKAGASRKGMLDFLKDMAEYQRTSQDNQRQGAESSKAAVKGRGLEVYFHTHPSTEERILKLKSTTKQ